MNILSRACASIFINDRGLSFFCFFFFLLCRCSAIPSRETPVILVRHRTTQNNVFLGSLQLFVSSCDFLIIRSRQKCHVAASRNRNRDGVWLWPFPYPAGRQVWWLERAATLMKVTKARATPSERWPGKLEGAGRAEDVMVLSHSASSVLITCGHVWVLFKPH